MERMMNADNHLSIDAADLIVQRLGDPMFASPMARLLGGQEPSLRFVRESDRILLDDTIKIALARGCQTAELPSLEPGGPRESIYFDPACTRVGIATCGGLCPGLNNVIRGLVLELSENYGVTDVVGFRNGYRGLAGDFEPLPLNPLMVADIHNHGSTVLGTSRDGGRDTAAMVATLVRLGVSVLFVIGGDGALRGAQEIADAASARGLVLSVIGVPKAIDNDIPYIDHSFGFQTALARAADSVRAARTEVKYTPNGVAMVKLIGQRSGFLACYAALANHDVDCVLIPEVPVRLDGPDGFLAFVRQRVERRGYAVIVVAEGVCQDLIACNDDRVQARGARLTDVGRLLCERMIDDFADAGVPVSPHYVEPGYAIREAAADAYDAVYCLRLAQTAVHAAMAGRTAMLVARWHGRFVHLPISVATSSRRQVDPNGDLWMSVLEATGQPSRFR
jgi:6-phosphofructokinase 1